MPRSIRDVEILDLNSGSKNWRSSIRCKGKLLRCVTSAASAFRDGEALGVSESTVKREWVMAKTWIRRRLVEGRKSRDAGRLEARKDLFSSALVLPRRNGRRFSQHSRTSGKSSTMCARCWLVSRFSRFS